MAGNYDQFFQQKKKLHSLNKKSNVNSLQKRQKNKISKNKIKKRSKKSFPLIPVLSCSLLLLGSIYANLHSEEIYKFLSKLEITVGLTPQAIAQENTAETNVDNQANTSSNENTKAGATEKKTESWTEEEITLFKSLEKRNAELNRREEELNSLAAELQKQKTEIDKKIKKLEGLRAKISNKLEEKIDADEEKVQKLVNVYSNMKPAQAAQVFENLDEDLAIAVLGKMKKKNAADILNLVKADKARVLSEKYAGYIRKQ